MGGCGLPLRKGPSCCDSVLNREMQPVTPGRVDFLDRAAGGGLLAGVVCRRVLRFSAPPTTIHTERSIHNTMSSSISSERHYPAPNLYGNGTRPSRNSGTRACVGERLRSVQPTSRCRAALMLAAHAARWASASPMSTRRPRSSGAPEWGRVVAHLHDVEPPVNHAERDPTVVGPRVTTPSFLGRTSVGSAAEERQKNAGCRSHEQADGNRTHRSG